MKCRSHLPGDFPANFPVFQFGAMQPMWAEFGLFGAWLMHVSHLHALDPKSQSPACVELEQEEFFA